MQKKIYANLCLNIKGCIFLQNWFYFLFSILLRIFLFLAYIYLFLQLLLDIAAAFG